MNWSSTKFALTVLCSEVAMVVMYTFFVTYDKEADVIKPNRTEVMTTNSVQDYYPMFQDVNVMILVGFGFLMTFLKKYGYSAVGLNFLLAAISVQWGILMHGVWNMKDGTIYLGIIDIIGGNFASATVLISFGALLGKTSPLQLVAMSILEIAIFACNEQLGVTIFKAADIGGSIFLHTFGAYFGLSVSYMLYRKEFLSSNKEASNYHSDIFAMIGTLFLWMFWPSFNSALAVGNEQHRSVINTYVALLASCITTFAMSSLTEKDGRLNMVHVQNATLAGGVAIGSTANMVVHPYGAMLVGVVAALISTLGYKVLTPLLAMKFRIHDTCGVNNLHGMPGILAGLVSAVVASMATVDNYGLSLYQLYPSRIPEANTTDFNHLKNFLKELDPGEGWSASSQAYAQLEALLTTLAIAISGGLATGYIIRHPFFDPPTKDEIYDDVRFWEVAEDEHL